MVILHGSLGVQKGFDRTVVLSRRCGTQLNIYFLDISQTFILQKKKKKNRTGVGGGRRTDTGMQNCLQILLQETELYKHEAQLQLGADCALWSTDAVPGLS